MARALPELRQAIDAADEALLEWLNRRTALALEAWEVKEAGDLPLQDPRREEEILDRLVAANPGPLSDDAVRHLFREILAVSRRHMAASGERRLRVARRGGESDRVVRVAGRPVGGAGSPICIAGPCAVEDAHQIEEVAAALAASGAGFLRGGAVKPRSSPYAFQGLGPAGWPLLAAAARRHGLATVSEVTDPRQVADAVPWVDLLQIGARNMQNFDLLREVAAAGRPVLLKRGIAATLDELLWAAEYLVLGGCPDVILCERGIRTFETRTRNTLDLAAVALLRRATPLPVVVDVSHAAGRRDILVPLARAALAVGAHGVMVEVHPRPDQALSDGPQQLDLPAFRRFLAETGLGPPEPHLP